MDYSARIDDLAKELRETGKKLPVNEINTLASDLVAERLGFVSSLQIPPDAWRGVLDLLRETDRLTYDRTMRRHELLGQGRRQRKEGSDVGLSERSLYTRLAPWTNLWKIRDKLSHDPLSFRPIELGESAGGMARGMNATSTVPTPAPPVYQACYLINAALEMILEQSGTLKGILELVRQAARKFPALGVEGSEARNAFIADGMREMRKRGHADCLVGRNILDVYSWRQTMRGERRHGYDLRQLLFILLAAACAIGLSALVARRMMETLSLKDDCVFSDDHGALFMSCWIEKSARALDSVPIPRSVECAIDVLKWLSEDARASDGTQWLFKFIEPDGSGRRIGFSMTEAIRMFAEFVGVPALANGEKWHFTTKQFRTFFSMVYYHRWHFPSLTALSNFLKHNNPDVTRGYVTAVGRSNILRIRDERDAAKATREEAAAREAQAARAADFEAGRMNFMVATLSDAITGKAPISGHGGDLWMRDLSQLVRQFTRHTSFSAEGTDATFETVLRGWVKGKSIEPHPAGHSYCKCGSDRIDLAVAACLGLKRQLLGEHSVALETKPDHAFAADEVCADCPHNLHLQVNEPYWDRALLEAERAAGSAATSRQRSRAEERRHKIASHIERCRKGRKGPTR